MGAFMEWIQALSFAIFICQANVVPGVVLLLHLFLIRRIYRVP
jgi:hypothetical protein